MFCKQTFTKLFLVTYRNNYLSVRWKTEVRMTKQLKKMMNKGPKKKAWYLQPNPVASDIMSQSVCKGPTDGQRRRAVQVGKVLYGYIIDIVNSGELCPQLAELAVSIDRVTVIPDFSAINVHWLATESEEEAKIETLLRENAGKLRHILTSYHLLGRIPIINFVKDDGALKSLEVEKLLSIADFGPDYQPTTYTTQIRTGIKKSDIASDFKKLSLQHADSQAYPDIMTVSSTGAMVYENKNKTITDSAMEDENTKNPTTSDATNEKLEAISEKLGVTKESFNSTDKNVAVEQRNDPDNEQKDIKSKDFTAWKAQLGLDTESRIKVFDDERVKPDDVGKVKLRNDVYALLHENLIKKLMMKKRRAKHRMSVDSFVSSDVKESETTAQTAKPNYREFLRRRRRVKRMKGKIPYTIADYLLDEGTDYWNILPKERDNDQEEFPEEES